MMQVVLDFLVAEAHNADPQLIDNDGAQLVMIGSIVWRVI